MAIEYFDYGDTSSSSSDNYSIDSTAATATTTSNTWGGSWYRIDASSWFPPPPRRILVKHPMSWSREDSEAYVRLVNCETNTGWRVEMLISGDIVITDPDIDVRTMKEFEPLLTFRASNEDRQKIAAFFADHPIDGEYE